MSTAAKPKAHKVKLSGYTYKETYDLYNQQLHYARSHYTTAQLNAWQTDWNKYFTKYGMEIPAYAHKIEAKKGKSGKAQFAAGGNERSTAAVRGSTAPSGVPGFHFRRTTCVSVMVAWRLGAFCCCMNSVCACDGWVL